MANTKKGYLNSLKNIFGITTKTPENSDKKIAYPANKDPKRGTKSPLALNLPDEIQRLYDYWLKDTYEDSKSLKDRMQRYASLEYSYYNSSIISLTIDLYADEVLQSDSQKEVLNVDSKDKKVRKYIIEFFDKIGLNPQTIKNLAWNLALYGDSFAILSSNEKEGITEIVPIDVYSVKERFDFKATEISKKQNKNKRFGSFVKNDQRLKKISDLANSETTNYADYFRSYLFGFELSNGLMVNPWNLLHFRGYTTQSEFWPFGRPILINSLAPFRQLQAGKNLMALARAYSFPLKHFEVNTGDNVVDPATQWEVVQEAKEQYNNMSNEQTGKEEFAANSELWTPKDQIDFQQYDAKMDLEKIADIEMLRDDLIMGTKVPKGYLIVDKSSFGTSGQSLLRQHKPFARAVYSLQTAILEQITQLVRLQFAMTGDFEYDQDFEISMNYPMVEESRDRVQVKNDTLRLAKDTVDNLGQAMGLDRGEALPPEVVKQIFTKLSFLSDEDIDEWVDATIDKLSQDSEGEEGKEDMFASYNSPKQNKIVERLKKYNESEFTGLVDEAYYQARKNLREGVLAKTHYYTSQNMSVQERKLLDVIAQDRVNNKKLNEKEE